MDHLTTGCIESSIDRPTESYYSSIKGAVLEPCFFGPLTQRHRFPAMTQKHRGAPVKGLLAAGRPIAIVGRIVAVVVSTFNRIASIRSWSQVFVKCREIALPFLAYADSTLVMAYGVFAFRIAAALFHRVPDFVFRQIGFPMGRVITFEAKTPAGAHLPMSESAGKNSDDVAAGASTQPPYSVGARMACCLLDYLQSSKCHIGKVKCFSHMGILPYGDRINN